MADIAKPAPGPEKTMDKQIVLTVQQIFAYGAFLITVGASVYTFFQAIPKIDKLDDSINKLQVSNAHCEERITSLQTEIKIRKEIQDAKNIK